MKSKQLRDITFILHRYIGLAVGAIAAIIGLTGSFLVFSPELENFWVAFKFGHVIPQGDSLSIDAIFNIINAAIANQSDIKIGTIILPKDASFPYEARLLDSADKLIQMFINPYTGEVIGSLKQDHNILRLALHLHYELLAGQPGQIVAGIIGLLLFILSITGLILWPGWRKLIAGFKIKWDAHPKRLNFDIHKVVGILVAVSFVLSGLTGFCWNFYDQSVPIIHALTFTPKPPEIASQPIRGQSPILLSQILEKADAAMPNAKTTHIRIANKPEGVIRVLKKQNQDTSVYGESQVFLDQYSGQVLHIVDGRSLPLGDRVLNSFVPIHYGTFAGIYSRIFYIIVGLSPTILFITGLVMWWHRRRIQPTNTNLGSSPQV
jgi:uncharacterized iron-regulated membrane protein